jgi:sRNA-binding carbon storage regulator CsrA
MALVVNRRHGQPLRLTTPDGSIVLVTVRPGHQEGEVKLTIDAPRSVIVERPERDQPSLRR